MAAVGTLADHKTSSDLTMLLAASVAPSGDLTMVLVVVAMVASGGTGLPIEEDFSVDSLVEFYPVFPLLVVAPAFLADPSLEAVIPVNS